jgi:hypothetical protein
MDIRPTRQFKFSGRVAPNDVLHQTTSAVQGAATANEHYIAPTTVQVTITTPPSEAGTIGVPQYAGTVSSDSPNPPYDPAQNCGGYFTSCLYQPNNNCYAYACNTAPNTFPQPGRASGCLISPATLDGETISGYAVNDGLVLVGTTIQECLAYQSQHSQSGQLNGHFVALMISPPGDVNWPGDYHWARCDNSTGPCNSWSQKDGNDQITNFDFAGNPITDPSAANWTVNQGPLTPSSAPATDPAPPDTPEVVVTYNFYCFMFVPFGAVNII